MQQRDGHTFQNGAALRAFYQLGGEGDALPVEEERARRWRLILGKAGEPEESDGEGQGEGDDQSGDEEGGDQQPGPGQPGSELSEEEQAIDEALDALYGEEGGLGDAAPDIARWLGDIHRYFSAPVAEMLQQDALKRLDLRKILDQPELLAEIEPDVQLVSKLLNLSRLMPAETKETARAVVRKVVEELMEQLRYPLWQAINGSVNRALRQRRPHRQRDIHWQRTIHANLRHYQPSQGTVVPETLIGYGHQRSSLRDVILCMDQSASMSTSVVYASIFGAVMASIPALDTRLVAFSTDVVDLTGQLDDPVDLLFGVQLRGGTNIARAVAYCQQQVTRPNDTILVLITDLYEGGKRDELLQRVRQLVTSGVQVIVLLALNDEGAPRFNRKIAEELVALRVPAFACTPDLFPELMGAAINGEDIGAWAAGRGIVTAPRN